MQQMRIACDAWGRVVECERCAYVDEAVVYIANAVRRATKKLVSVICHMHTRMHCST